MGRFACACVLVLAPLANAISTALDRPGDPASRHRGFGKGHGYRKGKDYSNYHKKPKKQPFKERPPAEAACDSFVGKPKFIMKTCPKRCQFIAKQCMDKDDALLKWSNEAKELGEAAMETFGEAGDRFARRFAYGKDDHLLPQNGYSSMPREPGTKGVTTLQVLEHVFFPGPGSILQTKESLKTAPKNPVTSSLVQQKEVVKAAKKTAISNQQCKSTCQRFGFSALGSEFASIHNVGECVATCDEVYPPE